MHIGNSIRGDLRAVLLEVAQRLRIETSDARPVRRHSNMVLALPSAGMVLRVAGNPDSLDRVTASLAVTKWLGERGFPCVLPVDVEQPLVVGGRVVSVWRLLDVTSDAQVTGQELGRLLRTLHDQAKPPFPLRELGDPLAGVARTRDRWPAIPGGRRRVLREWDEVSRRLADGSFEPVTLSDGAWH